ncbi:uncharacterized protein C56G2.4 [Aplysia californica]|uniref:Uncharacterized protein C56G2.4 n=1 Tax=Aplysia californica TaxID=6500 RepID=A0ABM0JW53_APLCA|nr:uncharacterized protein C56G2.4 [Aplysia californica]
MKSLTLAFVSVVLLIAETAADGHGHTDCFKDEQQCIQKFRSLLTDTDSFWFGSQYAVKCPSTPGASQFGSDPSCSNPDSKRLSVLSRLLKTDNVTEVAAKLSLAHVTYTVPRGEFFACGHTFTAPALTNYKLDPLSLNRVSLWSIDHTPEVTWPSQDGVQYTVIVWDVGNFFLHGLYINAVNGDMSTGEAVDKYHGPRASRPYANVYLFIVVPQSYSLDVNMVKGIMFGVLSRNAFQFSAVDFFSNIPGAFGDPVAANLLNIVGDVYGAQRMKDSGILDNCPFLVSQETYLHNALRWANIDAAWSYDVDSLGTMDKQPEERAPFLTSLEVNLEPVYSTDDIEFESCCSKYTYIGAMLLPDPFSSKPQRPVHVRTTPRVEITLMNWLNRLGLDDKMFTLMMVDFGSIQDPPQMPAFIVHWLVTDIQGADVTSGNTVIPYFGSNPFTRDSARMYTFLLFEQSTGMLDTSSLTQHVSGSCVDPRTSRCRYYVNDLIKSWGLGDIKGVTWFLAEQDPFARLRIYREFAAQPKMRACAGIRGYMEPCPLPCGDYVADDAPLLSASLASLSLATALTIGYLF